MVMITQQGLEHACGTLYEEQTRDCGWTISQLGSSSSTYASWARYHHPDFCDSITYSIMLLMCGQNSVNNFHKVMLYHLQSLLSTIFKNRIQLLCIIAN